MNRLIMFSDSKWILLCADTLQTLASGEDFYLDKPLQVHPDAEALACVSVAIARDLLLEEHERQVKRRAH
jgi:hypothetical protein